MSQPVTMRRLAHIDDIADGAARGFDPCKAGQPSLFVVRRGARLFAYRDRCPHQDSRLAWRRDAYLNRAGDRIVCFGHGAEFDVASGECLAGPCPGQSLTPVQLDVAANGDIYLLEHDS